MTSTKGKLLGRSSLGRGQSFGRSVTPNLGTNSTSKDRRCIYLRQLHFVTRTTMTTGLSRQLRDRVSLHSNPTNRQCAFQGLPLEILEMIFGECDLKDLPSLLQTANFLRVQSRHVNCTDIRMPFKPLVMAMISKQSSNASPVRSGTSSANIDAIARHSLGPFMIS